LPGSLIFGFVHFLTATRPALPALLNDLAVLFTNNQAERDARIKEGKRPGGYSRRQSQEREEIDGMVDIYFDSRLADDERFDPTVSRRIEMRVEADARNYRL
jgi:hypothetical protein